MKCYPMDSRVMDSITRQVAANKWGDLTNTKRYYVFSGMRLSTVVDTMEELVSRKAEWLLLPSPSILGYDGVEVAVTSL